MKGVIQNSKESQQAHGDFLDFIIGKTLSEFLLVNFSEFLDSLAAQLLWCCHASHFTGARVMLKGGEFC